MKRFQQHREILLLAIPNILSNISVPLLSSVDTSLVGHLSEMHLAATGLAAMLFNFIYWNFGFLRMGTTGITAQAFGARNEGLQGQTLLRALLVSLLLSVVLLLFGPQLLRLGSWLMQVSTEQLPYVSSYFNIRIWAAPATLGLYVIMGWFFGMQNAWYPLYLTLVINVVNMGVSYYGVNVLGLGIAGVAWGTVCAQYVGLLTGVLILIYRYRFVLTKTAVSGLFEGSALLGFLSINKDIFIRTFCLTLVFGSFYSYSSALGVTLLAVSTILMQYINWFSFAVDGFAYAAESIVGKYKGAAEPKKLQASIRLVFIWSTVMALGFSLFYAWQGEALLNVFTNQESVINMAVDYLWWIIILPVFGMPCYIWDGVFVGLTAVKSMRNTMLMAMISYFVVIQGSSFFSMSSIDVLFAALMMFLVIRGLGQGWLYRNKGVNLV